MPEKYDIEAMLTAYRDNLRKQMEGIPDADLAYRVHTMFQEPTIRFLYDSFNAGDDDILRIGLNLSVAIATALQSLMAHVPDADQEMMLGMMMNNIYSNAHRLLAAARAAGPDPDRQINPGDFTIPVN